jgi:hypothetical protein
MLFPKGPPKQAALLTNVVNLGLLQHVHPPDFFLLCILRIKIYEKKALKDKVNADKIWNSTVSKLFVATYSGARLIYFQMVSLLLDLVQIQRPKNDGWA